MVTGPNGSGKSNILDGILFCLGLANSKGMRADNYRFNKYFEGKRGKSRDSCFRKI